MAQPSPLRNRTFYAASNGTVFSDPGAVEGWHAAGQPSAAPPPPAASTTPAAASAAPNTTSGEKIMPRFGKQAAAGARTLGTLSNLGLGSAYEGLDLANTARTQGTDAAMAQLPNAAARVAGSEVGMRAGANLGQRLAPGAWKVPAAIAGGIAGNYLGRLGGDRATQALQDANSSGAVQAYDTADRVTGALNPTSGGAFNFANAAAGGLRGALRAASNTDGSLADRAQAGLRGALAGGLTAAMDTPAAPDISPLRRALGTGRAASAPAASADPRFSGVTAVDSGPTVTSPYASTAKLNPNFIRGQNGVRNVSVTDDERKAARQAEADVLPTVDYGPNYAQGIQRRGSQGGVIRNPGAMSTTDRIAELGTSMKGFPSLRRAAAEQIMREDQRYEDDYNAARAQNDAADADQTRLQAQANESYADRRLKANLANASLREDRRSGDANRQLEREKALLSASGGLARRGPGAAAANAAQDFTKLANGYGGDYDQAAANTYRNLTDAGVDPESDPLGTIAATRLSDADAAGRQRVNERGPFGTSLFSPNDSTAGYSPRPEDREYVERNPFERIASGVLPWGAKPSDYKRRDLVTGATYYTDVAPMTGDIDTDNRLMSRVRQLRNTKTQGQ